MDEALNNTRVLASAEYALLKGSVSYSRTVNLWGSNFLKVEWTSEFRLGERTHEEVTLDLERRLVQTLKDAGLMK